MATNLPDPPRKILPRWRLFDLTVQLGELNSLEQDTKEIPSNLSEFFFEEKINDWRKDKTFAVATDILGLGFSTGNSSKIKEVAKFVIEHPHSPKAAFNLAQKSLSIQESVNFDDFFHILDKNHIEQIEQIHNLRLRLIEEPRNSIACVDMAYYYTLLNQQEKARSKIELALKLNPENRFILRSAARFFVHYGDTNRAHQILRRADSGKYDPWLSASEIAVANLTGNPSRFAKSGIKQIKNNELSPFELTELASAVATLEMTNGKRREARKLFKNSLVKPNDNSLAQIEWAIRYDLGEDLLENINFDDTPLTFEVEMWQNYENCNWQQAFENAKKWFYDQPFSSYSVISCGYIIGSILGEYQEALKYLEFGKKINPRNTLILNNLAFIHATLGNIKEAQNNLQAIRQDEIQDINKVTVTATQGLVAFRSGNINEGHKKYQEAILLSKKLDHRTQLLANLYYTRECLLANQIGVEIMVKLVEKQTQKLNENDIKVIFEREIKPLIKLK